MKSKRKSTKKKNKNQAKEKKPDNANFDLEHKVHNVIIPKDSDYLNSFKVNYNEFSSDIFVNSMDSSRESRLNLINATDTTDGNPFALDIKCD